MDMQNTNYDFYAEPEKKGRVVTGFIGAVLGALIGAAAWAAVAVLLEIITALIGLLIGFLAGKGYDLLKGRQGKAKIVCVVLAVIIGVVVGVGATYAWQIHDAYNEAYGSLAGVNSVFVRSEADFFRNILEDSEVQGEILKNLAMGLVFAFLGCFGLLREMGDAKKSAASAAVDVSAASVPSADNVATLDFTDAQVPGRRIETESTPGDDAN